MHHAWRRKIVGIWLTQVCLELPWDPSQDEKAVEWCVRAVKFEFLAIQIICISSRLYQNMFFNYEESKMC